MNRVLICDYVRTPIGRYGGALSSVRADDLAAIPIRELVRKNRNLDPAEIDEVFLGCANQAGEDSRNVARMASLLAGLPETVPGVTVNRLCASGMDAVIAAARAIRCDETDVAIAGGVESMSRAPFVMPKAQSAFARQSAVYDTTIGWRFINRAIEQQYGVDSMPETAENVAEAFGISRKDQDRLALSSQSRAAEAVASGRFAAEIVPVDIQRRKDTHRVEADEHPRETTLDKLSSLPAPFREKGTVTAGNASGVNDGAAALILASETAVQRHELNPIAEILGAASAGVEPRLMGIGPVPATRKLCARLNLKISDFDLIELNEAFASQSIAVCRELDLDPLSEHMNPNGGAIALGHPLGMTGARLIGTAATQLKGQAGALALCTLCVGVGQGVSVAIRAV
ncbi:3-oxoadipyl-CoA thiolase [Ruegeria sp. SCPT10]|uniref:3-oxoadipyl-CoA thiolase n=1 Tax=Ruegeria sp. SCP10 TaxID=3141377 RepID=UPI00333670E6